VVNPATTLAHEIALSADGQHSFGHRLIAQENRVVGGMYTVRGYPESIAAGDDVIVGRAEYRLHIASLLSPIELKPDSTKRTKDLFGQDFKWARTDPYGRPDWDLIARAFFDVGRTVNSDRLLQEQDHTLMGAGVGLELLLRQNLSLRVDWATALRSLPEEGVKAGSSRFHVMFTLTF
jgi:hemolysin activation/secretion protein